VLVTSDVNRIWPKEKAAMDLPSKARLKHQREHNLIYEIIE